MLKKFLTTIIVLAATATAWADGWKVTQEDSSGNEGSVDGQNTYAISVITWSESGDNTGLVATLADAITAANGKDSYMIRIIGDMSGENAALSAIGKEKVDLSMATGMTDFSVFANNDAVKYVILPNGTAKENVNTLGGDVDAAASALPVYSYSDGWQYSDPNTGENVMTTSCQSKEVGGITYVNLRGTGIYKTTPTAVEAVYVKGDNSEYVVSDATPVLFKEGNAYGIAAGTVLSDVISDTYYIYNGQNRYDGSLFRTENGVKYGNTGSVIALRCASGVYTYSKDNKTFVYTEADVYSRGEKIYGLIGGKESVIELTKTIEYRTYGVDGAVADVSKYTIIGDPITEWGKTYYNTKEGVPLFVVCVYTYGDEQTKYEGEVFVLDGKCYGYIGENPFAELTKTADDTNTFYSKFSKEVYTGKLYDSEQGAYLGGTGEDVMLTSVTDYYIADAKYDGPVTEDSKGVADWSANCFQLAASYVHTYTDLAGNVKTVKTSSKLSEIDMTNNKEDLWIAAEACQVPSATATSVELTAYVSKPGSLLYVLARWTELGDGSHSGYGYKVTKVTALTLSGDVNYADIGTNGANKSISKYGHVQYYNSDTNTDVIPDGTVPESEKDNTTYYKDPDVQGHPNTIENNFAAMDGNALTYIDLTDAVFAVQTDMMFANVSEDFGTILLPTSSEMTLIPAKSFWGLNGEGLTEICIPYNYKEIGDEAFYNTSITHFYTTDAAGNTITNGPNTMTFSENLRIIKTSNYHVTFSGAGANTITDVYVMRFVEGAEPNDEDPLNFPTTQCQPNAFQASMTCGNIGNAGDQAHPISRKNFQNQSMWMSILHYPQSTDGTIYENMYTDLTRVYTLNDETGYVDGSGRPFKWPKHGEFTDASNSVKAEKHFDGTPYDADFLAKHRGWIEFVLVGKSNNQDIDIQSEIEFVQRDWYTLCVPYDLTKSNLLELFGIDDPTETTDTELVTMLGETEAQEVEEPMYPDVRVITEVSRSLNNAKVTFHLSKPLLNNADGNDYGFVIPEEGPNQGQGYEYVTLDGDDPVIIEGGHPFLVRGFVPKAWDPDIKNMGMYVMAIAASVNSAATIAGVAEEELPYQMSDKCLVNGVSLPCVKHHIHARNADEEGEYVYEDKNKTIPACYHFIGTYTETTVPQYSYYLGRNKNTKKHQFFRTTKETTKWNPYSAVIIGLNDPGYNDGDFTTGTSFQNIVVKWNEPKSDLVILEGEDPARAGQALSLIFDEGVADDTTTGITDVDVNVNVSNNKVYSINGQYMGTSLNKLPKGIYIINGQKKVVK